MKRFILFIAIWACAFAAAEAGGLSWTGGRWWGISVSYSQKWYSYAAGGSRHWVDFWGEGGNMQGVQFGLSVQPPIRYGLGVSTGIFCEIYSCRNNAETKRIEDVGLYFPVHAMWRHDFNRSAAIILQTGPGLTVGLGQRVIDPTNSLADKYDLAFDHGTPRRVNCYWEAGIGALFGIFRFQVMYGIGLTPSRRYLSTAGEGTHYYPATPTRLTFSAALMF